MITPSTTRAGSERTSLKVGDKVRVERTAGRSGTWARFAGRTGWVATVNRQRFPDGTTYVEIGVTWHRHADWSKAHADVWFRADELVATP